MIILLSIGYSVIAILLWVVIDNNRIIKELTSNVKQ